MTINKILVSTVAASVLTVSSFAAGNGSIAIGGGINSISQELIDASDVNVSFTNVITYTNGMEASSATEPGFELIITGATMLTGSGTNLAVKVADGQGYTDENLTMATFDRLDGSSIIFSTVTGKTVERTKKYMIVTDTDGNATHSNSNTVAASDLNVTLAQGTSTVNAQMKLYSNSGDSTLDEPSAQILETKQQFTGSFGDKLNAQIDAALSFTKFEDSRTQTAVSTTKDDFTFTVSNDKDITYPAVVTKFDVNITADASIAAITGIGDATTDAFVGTGAWSDNDFNATRVGTDTIYCQTIALNHDNNGSITEDMEVTIDGTTALSETNFLATGKVYFDGGAEKTLFSGSNAGAWTVYGYNAKVPSASLASNGNDTVVTVVNTGSSTTTEAYVTLIDKENNQCSLNSVEHDSVTKPIPGGAHKYRLSAMLAETDCAALSGTGYAIEISIPTTPTDIYSNANVVNTTTGGKMLPVYNNGDSF